MTRPEALSAPRLPLPSLAGEVADFAALVQRMPLPLVLSRAKGGEILFANEAALETFGVDRATLGKARSTDFYADPADRQVLVTALQRDGRVQDMEVRLQTAGGRVFWALLSAQLVSHRDGPLLFVGLQDITERRRAEEAEAALSRAVRQHNAELEARVAARTNALSAVISERQRVEAELRRSEKRLQDTMASMDQGLAVYDADGRLIVSNHRFGELLQAPASIIEAGFVPLLEHCIGRGDFGDVADPLAFIAERLRAIKAGALYRHERPIPNGRWIQVNGNPLAEGGFVVTLTDITPLKTSEAELRKARDEAAQAQEKLSQAIEAVSEGFVLFDADDRLVMCNSKYRENYTFGPEFLAPGLRFEDLIREGARRGRIPVGYDPERWVAERLARHHNPDGPYVVQRPDGRWVRITEYRLKDGGTVGIRTDITELKEREAEIENSRRLLRAVIDAVPAVINVKDRSSRYLLMNRFQGEAYGVDPQAAIGRTSSELVGAAYGDASRSFDEDVIRSGAAQPFRERDFTAPGGRRYVWFTAKTPLKDEAGRLTHVVTVALDITRLKETEHARANLARYFPPNMVELLAASDEPFGPVRAQPIAVLFADIMGFTRLCAEEPPETVFDILRAFEARLAEQVFACGGTIDKFTGDGIMATFGTPQPGPRDAANALRCARQMLRKIVAWNDERKAAGQRRVPVAIGLHYGPVLLGHIGVENRLEFAVVGDNVNIASRLEKLTRTLDAALVVSDALVREMRRNGDFDEALLAGMEFRGPQPIRGRTQPVRVWTLRADQADAGFPEAGAACDMAPDASGA